MVCTFCSTATRVADENERVLTKLCRTCDKSEDMQKKWAKEAELMKNGATLMTVNAQAVD